MLEKNVKITISYNGNFFYGWQRQKNFLSVQQVIEETLEKIFHQKIKINGCGRTDSKTHAISYIANFKVKTHLPLEKLKKALNSNLPHSIFVKKVEFVKNSFHSRYDIKEKTYRYLISNKFSPFLNGYIFYVKGKLDLKKMKKSSNYLIGRHNFSSFQSAGSSVTNPIREIKKISFKEEKYNIDPEIKILVIEISANGFLYKMARNIIGTLVEVGKGKIEPERVKEILKMKDRKIAPSPVPSYALYLKKVKY